MNRDLSLGFKTGASPTRDEIPFSPALRRAVDGEARIRCSRGFDEEFFARLDERRAYNATWRGRFEQLLERELGGVAVWRLLGSGALGAAFPALVIAVCVLGSTPQSSAPSAPVLRTITPWNQRRFWEEFAWKNPARATVVTLFDPNWNGGAGCEFRFVV